MFLCLCQMAVAQQTDSVKVNPHTAYTNLNNFTFFPDSFALVDTSLNSLHLFDPYYFQNLGFHGSPVVPLIFNPERPVGFHLGVQGFQPYLRDLDRIPLFNTHTPYSRFYYAQGPRRLQMFEVTHSQNIKPNWNFTIDHQTFNSHGFYNRQRTSQLLNTVNTTYRTPNRRYAIVAAANWNNLRAQQNAGFEDDAEYTEFGGPGRYSTLVRLTEARQTYTHNSAGFKQFVYLGRVQQQTFHDTDTVSLPILLPQYYAAHQFRYNLHAFYFRDSSQNDLSFYPERNYSNVITRDRYFFRQYSNRISIGNTGSHTHLNDSTDIDINPFLLFEAFAEHDLIRPNQFLFDTNYFNFSIGGRINRTAAPAGGRLWGTDGEARLFLAGYNAGDAILKGNLYFLVPFNAGKNYIKLGGLALYQRSEPAMLENFIFSNHFKWNNNFRKISTVSIGGEAVGKFGKNTLSAQLKNTQAINIIYYDTAAQIRQNENVISYLQATATHFFRSKHFGFQHFLTFQTANSQLVRFPALWLKTSYYFERRVFKGGPVLLRLGVDANITSNYRSYTYMPATSVFYLQDSISVGNYPVIDFWATGQVKRFTGFVKIEHITQGMHGTHDFILPHYPMPPRALRLGLRWMFYD